MSIASCPPSLEPKLLGASLAGDRSISNHLTPPAAFASVWPWNWIWTYC